MADPDRVYLRDSIYRHARVVSDPDDGDALIYSLPEGIEYQLHDDMEIFVVEAPTMLYEITMSHYLLDTPDVWRTAEIVSQFQPNPILDLSVPVETSRHVYLPSSAWINAVVYGPTLTDIPDI